MPKANNPYFSIQEGMEAKFEASRALIDRDQAKIQERRRRVSLSSTSHFVASIEYGAASFPHELPKLLSTVFFSSLALVMNGVSS